MLQNFEGTGLDVIADSKIIPQDLNKQPLANNKED